MDGNPDLKKIIVNESLYWPNELTIDYEAIVREVIVHDAPTPQGLACDWYTNKLYWTDSDKDQIKVTTITKPYYRKVLYWTAIGQPRAIAVVPYKGLLFWIDWGEIPKIERASMDGNPDLRTIIVNESLYWPNGLTIDYEAELIYWADGHLKKIEQMDFNRENGKVIKNALIYPYAVTKFKNRLYWTDWANGCIYIYNDTDFKELFKPEQVPSDLHVWDASVQKRQTNPCNDNNGGCSHLCLLSSIPTGYSCGCPIGEKLI